MEIAHNFPNCPNYFYLKFIMNITFAGIQGQILESSPHGSFLVVKLSDQITIVGTPNNPYSWQESPDEDSGFESFITYVGVRSEAGLMPSRVDADRTYKMPKGYIDWETISGLVSVSLSTYRDGGDVSTYIHNAKMALWFVQDAPIYCLTPEIVDAFDRTDVLHKPQVMMNWKPSLPSFFLALPEHFVTPDGGKIDYLLVSNTSPEHPEWHQGQWKHGTVEEKPEVTENLFHISTVDSNETVWTSVTGIDDKGNLVYEKNANFGSRHLSELVACGAERHREFLETIRNLVLNVMLAIEHTPELFTTVTESETTKSKGFGTNPKTQLVRFPRWVGKNYQSKSDPSNPNAIRGSVRSHWRRGHWRVLEAGERWKQSKRIWIEPVFVNS